MPLKVFEYLVDERDECGENDDAEENPLGSFEKSGEKTLDDADAVAHFIGEKAKALNPRN
jgi:hypothetical protein